MAETNQRKAGKLYAAIDASGGYYKNPVEKPSRSWMNVAFTLKDDKLDEPFLKGTKAAGLVQLKGHRSVGGMRASIYNAMPEAGIDAPVYAGLHEEQRLTSCTKILAQQYLRRSAGKTASDTLVSADMKEPDGILLRSFKMHDMQIPKSLKAVGAPVRA
jgi:hypothetical protein